MAREKSIVNSKPNNRNHAAAQTALAALAQQLVDRSRPSRPMRASMQLAYRAVMEREFQRLEALARTRDEE